MVYPEDRNIDRLPAVEVSGPARTKDKLLTGLKFMQDIRLETNYLQQKAQVHPRGRAADKLPTAYVHSLSRSPGTDQAHPQHSPGREQGFRAALK